MHLNIYSDYQNIFSLKYNCPFFLQGFPCDGLYFKYYGRNFFLHQEKCKAKMQKHNSKLKCKSWGKFLLQSSNAENILLCFPQKKKKRRSNNININSYSFIAVYLDYSVCNLNMTRNWYIFIFFNSKCTICILENSSFFIQVENDIYMLSKGYLSAVCNQ